MKLVNRGTQFNNTNNNRLTVHFPNKRIKFERNGAERRELNPLGRRTGNKVILRDNKWQKVETSLNINYLLRDRASHR